MNTPTRLTTTLLLAGLLLPGQAFAQPTPLTPDEAFGDITRILTNAMSEEELQIKADGSVRLERRGFRLGMVRPAPVIGTADPIHIADLAKAIADAEFPSMPSNLSPPAIPVGATKFFFRVLTKNTPGLDRKVTGHQGFEGQYKAKLDAVNEVMNKIRANINTTPQPTRNFKLVQLETTTRAIGGRPVSNTVAITDDGKVEVRQAHSFAPGGLPTTKSGTATDAEMTELEDAVKLANMESIPDPVGPRFFVAPANSFLLTVKSDDVRHEGQTRGAQGMYGQFESRLRPLIDLAQRIGARISRQPAGTGFNTVIRNIFRPNPVMRPLGIDPSIEVLWGTSETFEIDSDGNAKFTWSAPNVRTRPISGKATPAELRDLNAAIDSARLSSIPSHLPQPIHIVAAPTFELNVDAPVSANQATIDGELGYYVQWDGQLRPVMKALDRIVERLRADDRPTRDEAKGLVEVRGYYGFRTVWLVESATMEYEVKPWSFARKLIKFEGHQAKVKGAVKDIEQGKAEIKATDLISPVREDLSGNVVVRGGEASIDAGGPMILPSPVIGPGRRPRPFPRPSHMIKTFGSAAAVLTKAPAIWATVDAWVFKDGYGSPHEAYVLGVRAKAKKDSDLTRWGSVVNKVRDGEEIILTRLSRSGNFVLAQPNSGRDGYLRVSDVSMGGMRLYSTPPTASPARTRGLSGAVGR